MNGSRLIGENPCRVGNDRVRRWAGYYFYGD